MISFGLQNFIVASTVNDAQKRLVSTILAIIVIIIIYYYGGSPHFETS